MPPEVAMIVCEFPQRLHPVSQTLLESFVAGLISTPEFLRFFSLPNSDYIALAQCFVTALTG